MSPYPNLTDKICLLREYRPTRGKIATALSCYIYASVGPWEGRDRDSVRVRARVRLGQEDGERMGV